MNEAQKYIKEVRGELNNLLNKAKNQDEYEYINLLLRVKGLKEDGKEPIIGPLDHINESIHFINDLNGLIKTVDNENTHLRLGLIIYCHIVEMNDLYSTIGNIFRICKGNEYDINLFSNLRSPTEKINQLSELTNDFNFKTKILDLINKFYDNQLRNSFAHSSYFLQGNLFSDTSSKKFNINGKSTLDIQKDIYPRLKCAENYFKAYLEVLHEHKMSYKKVKQIDLKNKFLPDNNGEIYAAHIYANSKDGLQGLRIFAKIIIEDNDL